MKLEKRAVNCYSRDGNLLHRFASIFAVRRKGFCPSSVGKAAKGALKTHRNFLWLYANSKLKPLAEYNTGIAVECLNAAGDVVHVYDCIEESLRDGFTPNAVSKCIRGKLKSHAGFYWRRRDTDTRR